jgi:hypothetical protein
MYDTMLGFVQGTEEKLARQTADSTNPDVARGLKVPLSLGDVAFLAEDLWKGRSAVTGISTRLVLVRWHKPTTATMVTIGEGADEQKSSNVRLRDLVVMTKEEANRHEKAVLKGTSKLEELYDAETIAKIEARLEEAVKYEKYRA